MRMFTLERDEDVTGISGTGTVAEGVEFTDGTVTLRWLTAGSRRPDVRPTIVIFDGPVGVNSVLGLHGHDGKTRLVWDD